MDGRERCFLVAVQGTRQRQPQPDGTSWRPYHFPHTSVGPLPVTRGADMLEDSGDGVIRARMEDQEEQEETGLASCCAVCSDTISQNCSSLADGKAMDIIR